QNRPSLPSLGVNSSDDEKDLFKRMNFPDGL
ncbi:MAG: hypothetical protein ACJAU6_003866, partial [Alphaproteobacteria bacterium]